MQSLPIQDVKVTLLLAGGHQYNLYLKSDTPLLHSLLSVVALQAQGQEIMEDGLFQIPLEEGRSVLCFARENLIGVLTEPPVLIEQAALPHLNPGNAAELLAPAAVIPAQSLQIDGFLSPEELQHLLEFVEQQEPNFVPTTTSTNAENYRASLVLHFFPEFSELVTQRVKAMTPDILRQLGLTVFPPSAVEAQLTAHNDQNFYKIHNDNGSPDTATRQLTYVYYFYREPKAFSGGELLLYDGKLSGNFFAKADSFQTIDPRNNSIVFFPSYYMHEVLTVRCPSKTFTDSRFTINGWIRR